MSSVRDAAWQAHLRSQQDREGEARAAVASVLEPYDPAGLDVVDLHVGPPVLVVLSDGDVALAVHLRDGGADVTLVDGTPGEWTSRGQVTSLAQLGRRLGPPPVEDDGEVYPEWTPSAGAGDGYVLGARVVFEGEVWEVVATGGDGRNVWPPAGEGAYGWQRVAG